MKNGININNYLTEAELDESILLTDGIKRLAMRVPGYEWLLGAELVQTPDLMRSTTRAVLRIPGSTAPPPEWIFYDFQPTRIPLRAIKEWVDGIAERPEPSLLVELTKLRQQKLTKELLREGIARWDSYGRSPHNPYNAQVLEQEVAAFETPAMQADARRRYTEAVGQELEAAARHPAEKLRADLETYWDRTRGPRLSGLGLKIRKMAGGRLRLVFFALQGDVVRLVHTLNTRAEIEAFTTRDLEKLLDGIYERGPVNAPALINTPEEAETAFGPTDAADVAKNQLRYDWAFVRAGGGLSELRLNVSKVGPEELSLAFHAVQDGRLLYACHLAGRAALVAFSRKKLGKLAASVALAMPRTTPKEKAARPPQLTEGELHRLKEARTKEHESGSGIAKLFPEAPPAAALKQPRFCAHCGHSRGCMCPREKPHREPQVINDPLGGRARNRM